MRVARKVGGYVGVAEEGGKGEVCDQEADVEGGGGETDELR